MTPPEMPSNARSGSAAKAEMWRYAAAAAAVLALGAVIVARLVLLQAGPERAMLARMAREGYSQSVPVPRGLIYDSEGHLLAGDRTAYELDIRLAEVPETALPKMASDVAAVLGLEETVLERALIDNKAKGVVAVLVSNQVDEKERKSLEALAKGWPAGAAHALTFVPRLVRYYPEGTLAANVLGFVSPGTGKGLGGVEQYYDSWLKGGLVWVNRPYAPWGHQGGKAVKLQGPAALYLTIDRALQRAAEDEAWRAVKHTKAVSATIVVADPYTGALLAVAEYPRPNLNDYQAVQAYLKKWNALDFAIERPYEPGSVFKIVTMASAINEKVVTPDTVFHDTGSFTVKDYTALNWNHGAWGDQTMVGCMQNSLNTCLAWVAVKRLGKEPFYDYLSAFGFGKLTGVDLGGEVPGFYRAPGVDEWWYSDWGSQAFGQAIDVTVMQMVAAASAVANGGYLVTPHVLRYAEVDGHVYPYRPDVSRRVLSPQASSTMRQMLTESLRGESSAALVQGYSVAGKTGTAEIALPNLGYSLNLTNASFVGWFPAEKPQYLIYVWLEKPRTSIWASVVAAPVFARMVRRVAAIEHVPPDDVRHQLSAETAPQP